MIYNFDEVIDRRGTHSVKWDAGELLKQFGLTERFDEETISLFVADMDFACPEPVLAALHERVNTRMFGYSLHSASAEYHEAIQGWFSRRHDWVIDARRLSTAQGLSKHWMQWCVPTPNGEMASLFNGPFTRPLPK